LRFKDKLKKSAEAGALRRSFPENIGNALTAEEMEGQQTFEGAAQAPGKSKPESVTPPSPRGERKPLPPLVSQPQSLNAPSSAELPEPFAGRCRPNCGLLRQGGLPNQVTTDPDQDYNDQMNRRHCFFVNASKEGEARSGPDIRCWQAADPSSAPP
jgi:hypothetical protein